MLQKVKVTVFVRASEEDHVRGDRIVLLKLQVRAYPDVLHTYTWVIRVYACM